MYIQLISPRQSPYLLRLLPSAALAEHEGHFLNFAFALLLCSGLSKTRSVLDEELRFRLEFASLLFTQIRLSIIVHHYVLKLGIEDERRMAAMCNVHCASSSKLRYNFAN